MSKSLSHIFLPGAGVATLALGLGIGMANRDYGSTKIETLEARLSTVEAQSMQRAQAAADEAAALQEQVANLQASAGSGGVIRAPAPQVSDGFGLGRVAHADELAAWDIDVLPDGRGLPQGRGDVLTGEEVFADNCASCHGDFAEGVDNWPALAGGFDTLADEDPVKTVGSYWPYLSTVWDYVNRSMPFGAAQTLTDDEVYAIVAYILYSNDIVDEDFELSHENFSEIQMANAAGFVEDDRPALEYAAWSGEPCMEACKDNVQITMRASVLDVTPDDGTEDEGAQNQTVTPESSTDAVAVVAAVDPELVAAGEKVFRKCAACHEVGAGAKNKSGPQLNGIVGRQMSAVDGFSYSNALTAASEEGRVWDEAELSGFLAKPRSYIKGTKMAFNGLRKDTEIAAIIAYLSTFEE